MRTRNRQNPAQAAFDRWVASLPGDPGSFRWLIAAAFEAGWDARGLSADNSYSVKLDQDSQ